MSDEKKEIQETPKFSVALTEKLNEVSKALPVDFNKERFVQNSLALLNDNPTLAKFSSNQIMGGLLKGAYMGCDFFNSECWLVPYKGQLQFQLSYKGEKKLAKKYATRPILDVYAKVVRQGDQFVEKIVDGRPSVDFNPISFNDGAIIGSFAVVLFKDGGLMYETMSLAEIEQAKKQGVGNTPAWNNFFQEMAKKTVLKRLCKNIDIDFENDTQLGIYREDGIVENTEEHEVVDALGDDVIDTIGHEVEGE